MSETQNPEGGAAAPWHSGADQETLGYWQNKGWIEKTPAEVAMLATKAAHEAQKFVGAPPDSLLRMPKDASDEAGWKAVWKRLGAPDSATDYDLSSVKDAALSDALRSTAAKLNLPKDMAATLAADLAKHMEGQTTATAAERQAKIEAERAELARNWGQNLDANTFVARKAAEALGVSKEALNALENSIGYAKVMDMFRAIGSKIGEDKFVTSATPGQTGVMSVSQAHDQLRELKADTDFVKRYMNGDSAAKRQMEALHTIIAGAM